MKKINVGVFGAGGRMGANLTELLKDNLKATPAVAISKSKKISGYQISSTSLKSSMSKNADVWIDFSQPEGFDLILKNCVAWKKPLVSGTTGLSQAQHKEMLLASKKIPILWASNMSLGILALKKSLESFSHLTGFDFQIEEIHHKMKKDKPSGTALTLQEKLKSVVVNNKIPKPISIRAGGVIGTHKIWAFSKDETLCFEHQATDRKVFAKGALWAALKIVHLQPGLYKLEDLL